MGPGCSRRPRRARGAQLERGIRLRQASQIQTSTQAPARAEEPDMVQAAIADVTARIRLRSRFLRQDYLARIDALRNGKPRRAALGCANLAHGIAACTRHVKQAMHGSAVPNLAIVTAYNDMLSAHQPY